MTSRPRVAILAAITALAAAAVASARDVSPTRGQTALVLTTAAADSFAAAGVTATVPASFSIAAGGRFSFDAVDEPGAGGSLPHTGRIVLTKGTTTLELTDPTVTIEGGRKPAGAITFLLGDARVTVATLDVSRYALSKDSAGFAGPEALLTREAADALNASFATTTFRAGLNLGEIVTTGVAQPVRFTTTGSTTATLSKSALTLLADNDVLVRPTGPATAKGRSVTFPVTGGRLDVVSVDGAVRHAGGLRFGAYRTGGFRLSYGDSRGYVLRSGLQKGLAVFTVRFGKKSTFGTEDAITVGKGRLFFAIEVARDLAKSLKVSPRELANVPIGTIDVNAPYVDLAR